MFEKTSLWLDEYIGTYGVDVGNNDTLSDGFDRVAHLRQVRSSFKKSLFTFRMKHQTRI